MLRNTADAWGRVSRAFHWGMLALVAVQVPLGFWMVRVYERYTETYSAAQLPLVLQTNQLHHTLGFIVLLAATARLAWRGANPTPALPGLTRGQRMLARATHGALYGLLFLFPLTGWAALSAYEDEFPIFFFGWERVPRIVPQAAEGSTFDYEFFADLHEFAWQAGAAVLALHVAGAAWHGFARRDGVLARMLRGQSTTG